MAVDTLLCVLFGKKWENGPFFRRRTTVRLGKYCTDGYCWIGVYKDNASVYQIREHYINSLTDKRSDWASYSTFVYIRISMDQGLSRNMVQRFLPPLVGLSTSVSKKDKKHPVYACRCAVYMCSIFSPPPPPHTHTLYWTLLCVCLTALVSRIGTKCHPILLG